ncbi:hypothetical protein EJB05_55565, partial [Eragrostis curvula]
MHGGYAAIPPRLHHYRAGLRSSSESVREGQHLRSSIEPWGGLLKEDARWNEMDLPASSEVRGMLGKASAAARIDGAGEGARMSVAVQKREQTDGWTRTVLIQNCKSGATRRQLEEQHAARAWTGRGRGSSRIWAWLGRDRGSSVAAKARGWTRRAARVRVRNRLAMALRTLIASQQIAHQVRTASGN